MPTFYSTCWASTAVEQIERNRTGRRDRKHTSIKAQMSAYLSLYDLRVATVLPLHVEEWETLGYRAPDASPDKGEAGERRV